MTVSVVSNCGSGGLGTGGVDSGTSIGSTESANVDDVEDSDGEVSKIDFRGVNLRTKKKRDGSGGHDNESCHDNLQQQPERPMSWEGELSDQEMSSNTITNQVACPKSVKFSSSMIFMKRIDHIRNRSLKLRYFVARIMRKLQWKEFRYAVQVLVRRNKSFQ